MSAGIAPSQTLGVEAIESRLRCSAPQRPAVVRAKLPGKGQLMSNESTAGKQVVIIGAGPAGLTAAYELTQFNVQPTVLGKGDKVGGLARTENYKGSHFDMGGHRFLARWRRSRSSGESSWATAFSA